MDTVSLAGFSRYFVLFDAVLLGVVFLVLGSRVLLSKGESPEAKALDELPGPWFARFTSFPLFFSLVRFRKAQYIDTLFARYGDVIRIGPKSVRWSS